MIPTEADLKAWAKLATSNEPVPLRELAASNLLAAARNALARNQAQSLRIEALEKEQAALVDFKASIARAVGNLDAPAPAPASPPLLSLVKPGVDRG